MVARCHHFAYGSVMPNAIYEPLHVRVTPELMSQLREVHASDCALSPERTIPFVESVRRVLQRGVAEVKRKRADGGAK